MAAGLVALLCLGVSLLITNVQSQGRCSVPTWNSELGENPFTRHRGNVFLAALLKGYCSYCVVQAGRLERLKNRLATEGYADIAMVIINGGEGISRSLVRNLINASNLTVLQDTPDHVMYRQIFRGNKDSFVVYDRCGQRIAYIPHPYSNLNSNVTERVLKAVHSGRHSCYCSLDNPPVNRHDVMHADQPHQPTHTRNNNNLGIDCPADDALCRRFVRRHRQNTLEMSSQHSRRRNGHNMGQRTRRHLSHGHGIRLRGSV